MTLRELAVGKTATVCKVGGSGALRQHFLDMGLIPGVPVTLIKFAPMGDPMELMVRGYELTLRLADAEEIEIEDVRDERPESRPELRSQESPFPSHPDAPHPGFGEHHEETTDRKGHQTKLQHLTYALAGNQNCGKTTLFNQLTGSHQHVGNFPGVTVDQKSGQIKGHPETEVVDLPGIYSLSPYTSEEIVSRQFILEQKPSAIINILDATNIERNLYLTMQLMELDIPMVLALNMMDEVKGNGGSIRINEMEEILGMPVIPISASKNEGVDELIDHAIHIGSFQEKPGCKDFCDKDDFGGAVHKCLHAIMHLIAPKAEAAGIPIRFAASKLVEGDPLVEEALGLDRNEIDTIEHIVSQMEKERGLDRSAAIADMRFLFIEKLCQHTVVKPKESREHARSARIDKILTGRYTAIPVFAAIMAVIFWLTFNVIGAYFQGLIETLVAYLTDLADGALSAGGVSMPLHSLIIDGIFSGVGAVLSFLPIIVILFFFLSMLEDSGYMARVAFVMDSLLRKIGLSGRSMVALLIGFGCTVPAVMSTRTLPSERDRRMTTFLIPFMSCSAKMPIYAFFTAAFFPGHGALIMVALYFLGIILGIVTALLSKGTVFKGEPVPFVMELPNYRLPGAKNVLHLMWDKAKDFLQRAFTVIFLATIVIWFLQNFDFGLNMVTNSQNSILAVIAGAAAPLFAPMGLGDWRIVTALISGFLAKESIVATISVLFGGVGGLTAAMSPLSALAMLVFCLLYTPCIAAIASVKRESGARSAVLMVIFQCVLAWIAALIIYLLAGIFI